LENWELTALARRWNWGHFEARKGGKARKRGRDGKERRKTAEWEGIKDREGKREGKRKNGEG